MSDGVVRAYRLGFAVLALAAVIVQLEAVASESRSLVNFFSFFTIQSNLIGIAVFAWLAVALPGPSRRVDLIRGATVVYLVVTGVVYALLLSGDPAAVEATIGWVNTVLHQVMPIAVVVDWIAVPPSARIDARGAAWWLAFPVAWTAYTLLRGAVTGWYPYPFLDPARHGAAGVVGYAVGIAVAFVVVIAAVAWIGNHRQTG